MESGSHFNDNALFGFVQLGEVKPILAAATSEVEGSWRCDPLSMAQFFELKLEQIIQSAQALYGLVQISDKSLQFMKWSTIRDRSLAANPLLYTEMLTGS